MTSHDHRHSPSQTAEDFTTSEGLRAVLHRLHREGPEAWKHDRIAADLVSFAAAKYAALARKHGLDEWEAASAAFDVMRTRSAREADDPWAVVTRAVQVSCIAEERGQGLLCATHQARRPHVSAFHDPERFADRESPLVDYHPAFQVLDLIPILGDDNNADTARDIASARIAIDQAVAFFALLGWPADTARAATEHVCGVVARTGSRHSAYEVLRRDKHARALLDLPSDAWSALVHVLLGNQHPAYQATATGRGILFRMLLGEGLAALLGDDDLVMMAAMAAPRTGSPR